MPPLDARGLGDGLLEEAGGEQLAEGPEVLEVGDAEGRMVHGCTVVGGKVVVTLFLSTTCSHFIRR
jgi:hypothetical protein